MKLNYEEKVYESYFNQELARMGILVHSTGQVAEGSLGFDASVYIQDIALLYYFSPRTFSNILNSKIFLRDIETYMKNSLENSNLVDVNVLFQYKRPEYITSHRSLEWARWNKPYFRYNIDKEQNTLLEKIFNKFHNEILILYAAPKIEDKSILIEKVKKNEIIRSSNICNAYNLFNHSKNTYAKDSNISIAFSEPERIQEFNLNKIKRENIKNESPNEKIINFSTKIQSIINEDIQDRNFKSVFSLIQDNQLNKMQKEFPIFHSIIFMKYFQLFTGLNWAWIYKNDKNR